MFSITLFITVCFLIQNSDLKDDSNFEHLVITTSSGNVQGNILKTRFDNEFYAFRGIRYGKPPIKELRFKPPEPAEFTDEIFDATVDGPACTQPYLPQKPLLTYSEDCLRLNIYTKHLPNKSQPTIKKPVIVNIPGGAFFMGSAATIDLGGPYFLMEQDIVLVTVNHRVGLLGFVSLNTSFAPGNIGLKDQVLALKWVKNNIEQFGGDPNAITLFGHSSGAISAFLHLVSPIEEKIKSHHIEVARKQAKYLNCTEISTSKQIFDCFKNADSLALANSVFKIDDFEQKIAIIKLDAVVEPDFGQERFLIEDPWVTFKSGNFTKAPMILGTALNEFSNSAVYLTLDKKQLKEFEVRFNEVAPVSFFYERGTECSSSISRSLWNGYELSHPLTEYDLPSLEQLFFDALLGYSTQQFLNIVHHSVDVFLYRFSYLGRFSNFYHPSDEPYGIQHSDDLAYIFPIYQMYKQSDPESKIVEIMTRFWAQFALAGNPTNKNDEYIGKIIWQPYTSRDNYYLEIDREMSMQRNLQIVNRKHVWDELFSEEYRIKES